MKIILYTLIFSILYLSLYIGSVNAQSMSNSNYIIQMGNFNSFSGTTSNSNYGLTFTGGQNGAFLFSGTNFLVKLGFQYIYPFAFRFSISSINIDFALLVPSNPVTRSNILTVTNHSAHGYQVTVSQNHNMRVNASGNEINPTICDSGPCTTTTAAPWTSPTTYGFGYNCTNTSGTDCPATFTNSTYYRPFVSSPSAVVVMSSNNVGTNRQATITYKVNVSQSQAAGLYTNVINYIATPTF